MPNNRAAASPKKAPCSFEELIEGELTGGVRSTQQLKQYLEPGEYLSRRNGREYNRWDVARRETGANFRKVECPRFRFTIR